MLARHDHNNRGSYFFQMRKIAAFFIMRLQRTSRAWQRGSLNLCLIIGSILLALIILELFLRDYKAGFQNLILKEGAA